MRGFRSVLARIAHAAASPAPFTGGVVVQQDAEFHLTGDLRCPDSGIRVVQQPGELDGPIYTA
ncbi:MAG: hypothetical protein IT193_10770 [Propionibacteriaceae bacterium]|nr:hypothetical protein [Propionibacteriaceae bacterium]